MIPRRQLMKVSWQTSCTTIELWKFCLSLTLLRQVRGC